MADDALALGLGRGADSVMIRQAMRISDLEEAVRDYLRECDAPVPDYALRRRYRDRLRELLGK